MVHLPPLHPYSIADAVNHLENVVKSHAMGGRLPNLDMRVKIGGAQMALEAQGSDAALHLSKVFHHLSVTRSTGDCTMQVRLLQFDKSTPWPMALSVRPPGIVAKQPDGPLMVELHEKLAIAVDLAQRQVLAVAGSSARWPSSHLSHPFAHAFGGLALGMGGFVTHGAVIGWNDRGVLIAGSGGQGKSTTALACAAAGAQFVGDDFFLLARAGQDGGFRAHSLYATSRLHPAQAGRFPELVAGWHSTLSTEDQKLTFFPNPDAVSLCRELPVEALVLPVVDAVGAEYGVTPLPRTVALRALLMDSARIYPWLTRERIGFYTEAVERLPCFTLKVGPDMSRVRTAVRDLLRRVTAA